MIKRRLPLLLSMLACATTGAADLVVDGHAVSEIVIAENAIRGVQLAAEDLQKHVALMSGATLPIVNAPSPTVENQVCVGESAFTEALGFKPTAFKGSGLEILGKGNALILTGPTRQRKASPYRQNWVDSRYLRHSAIAGDVAPKPDSYPSPGLKAWQDFCSEPFTTQHLNNGPGKLNEALGIHTNDDLGVWHAVAELLEQLGVRWYAPYEDGTVIPTRKTIRIADQHVTKEAAFSRREWCYYNAMANDPGGIKWLKRLKTGNATTILYNHTTYAIYSSYEQQQSHPEYLVRGADGKPYLGYPTGRGMPRYTDPGFRRAAVTYMNRVFDAYPDLSAMTVGPPDGGVKMDARDLDSYGTPTDTVAQKASNYVWDFHVYLSGELRKSHPGKCLLYMTGAGARELPTNIDTFPDNLIVPPRGGSSAYRVVGSTDRALIAARRMWLDKMTTVRKGPVWDYFLYYRTPTHPRYPVFFTESLQREMNEMLPYADGKFIEIQPEKSKVDGERHPRWRLGEHGLMHLMVYWQNKLFWDPGMDRQAMLDEYYALFFGPAEAEMRAFHEFAEEVWTRQESRSLTRSTGFLKEADVDRYFAILAKARTEAGAGTVYDRRIARIESEMQPLKKLFPNLKRTGPSIRAYPAPTPLAIDGELDEYRYGWAPLRDITTGETPAKNVTKAFVGLTPDKSALIVGAVCHESRMGEIKADCGKDDDFSIFQDDVVEVYVNTPERSYFKIVVNPNGVVWDESTDVAIVDRDTLPVLWNPGIKAAVRKFPDRWTVEILIPTKDFGELGPSKEYPWGIQVGRTRFTGGDSENWAIAPTDGGPYRTLNRWGNLWMR